MGSHLGTSYCRPIGYINEAPKRRILLPAIDQGQ